MHVRERSRSISVMSSDADASTRKFRKGKIVEWRTDGETVRGTVLGASGRTHVNVSLPNGGGVARVRREKLTIVECRNCGGGLQFGHQTWCGTAPGKLFAKHPEADTAELLAELGIA